MRNMALQLCRLFSKHGRAASLQELPRGWARLLYNGKASSKTSVIPAPSIVDAITPFTQEDNHYRTDNRMTLTKERRSLH